MCIRDSLALGSVPRKTDKRNEGQLNVPLHFGGITIAPGDFAYADETGVIFAEKALVS